MGILTPALGKGAYPLSEVVWFESCPLILMKKLFQIVSTFFQGLLKFINLG